MTRWFPIAPGTTLPAAPAAVGGQITVNKTVPVWNETVVAAARTRTTLSVTGFDYALAQLSELNLTSTTQLNVSYILPPASINVAAALPTVSTGSRVLAPSNNVQIAADAPLVTAGASLSIPLTNLAITALAPEYIGPQALLVNTPATELLLTSTTPIIATGTSIVPPVANVAVNAVTPTANPPAPYWSISWTGAGSPALDSTRDGYRFRVGATAIVVNTLSFYFASSKAERVIIHRDSDNAVMAQADILSTLNTWVSASVPEVTLAANTTYTISACATDSGLRNIYWNQSGITAVGTISIQANVWGSAGDNRPTNVFSSAQMGAMRFGYQ